MRTLYILATSERPDTYINTMIHVMRSYHDVSSMKLVTVSGPDSKDAEQNALTIMNNVKLQLDALCEGQYMRDIGDPTSTQPVGASAQQFYLNYYPDIKKMLGTQAISFARLGSELAELVGDGQCVFDVSALGKDLLADVFAVFLASGFREIYYFKLLAPKLPRSSSQGQFDLIHALNPRDDYRFVNLTGGDPVKKALATIRANLMQFRTAVATILLVAFIVLIVQEIYRKTWALSLLATIAVIGAIASAVFLFVDPRSNYKKIRNFRSRS
jgi:hypothetical protein